jgi:hypothetical protein
MNNIQHPHFASSECTPLAPIEHPNNIKRQTHLYCCNCNYCQSDYNIIICENCKIIINTKNALQYSLNNIPLEKLLYSLFTANITSNISDS